jgi:hypothetical protein
MPGSGQAQPARPVRIAPPAPSHPGDAVYLRILPLLADEDLEHATVLFEPGEPIRYVYFPESGIVSLVALLKSGAMAEAGMVGREGLVGLPVFLGPGTSPSVRSCRSPAPPGRWKPPPSGRS